MNSNASEQHKEPQSDSLNNYLPPSLMIRSYFTAGFAAVTFTAAETVWSSLAFFFSCFPDPIPPHFPSGLNRQGWGRPVGCAGAPGSGAAAEILIASLGFSLDPITLSSLDRRLVSLGSEYSTHTHSVLNITHWHIQMETETYSINVHPRTHAPFTGIIRALSRSAQACWCSWLQSNSKAVFWCAAQALCSHSLLYFATQSHLGKLTSLNFTNFVPLQW